VRYAKTTLLLLAFFVAGLTSTAGAQEAVEVEIASPPESCDDCHNGEADEDWMGSPEELLADSIHSDEECDSCHVDISMEDLDLEAENPHVDEMEPVDCGGCHEDEAVIYQKHGRLTVGKDPDLPECWDCHGSHDILPSSDQAEPAGEAYARAIELLAGNDEPMRARRLLEVLFRLDPEKARELEARLRTQSGG